MIEINLDLKLENQPKRHEQRCFYRGDYQNIKEVLSNCNWDEVFKNKTDINTTYNKFLKVIHHTIEQYVPLHRPKSKRGLPKHIKTILKTKKLLYKRINKDPISKSLYKDIDKIYKQAIRNYNSDLEYKILSHQNKKSFYGYINRKLRTNSHLPPLLDDNNNIIVDPEDKAELLNAQFSSVFTQDDGIKPKVRNPLFTSTQISPMEDIVISPSDIIKSISNLKNSVSQTPDQIPSYYLKQVSSSIAKPLATLFNLSLRLGKVPDLWKKAIVIPIYKKGLKSKPSNYRPISLTSVICRIMEHIIHSKLTSHFEKHNIISTIQHGFMRNRSTLTQQLNLLNELTKNYENKQMSDAVYLDFSKAFDSVSHSKLLHLLNHLCINSFILKWITDYLSQRFQQTFVQGHLSQLCGVSSGVPQGSVLGPLFFITYLEELLNMLKTCSNVSIYAFADDLKILSPNPQQLQSALNIVQLWSSEWQMKIQPSKSEHISFSNRCKPPPPTPVFHINNTAIPECSEVKDLGIILSNDFKQNAYIAKIHSKATNLVYVILKTFKSRDPFFYLNLYKMYTRPLLEYNVNIWMPCLSSGVTKVELIQKLFTRRLCKKLNISYNSYIHRLAILNLETLEIRRIKQDLILTYKILNNLIDLDKSKFISENPCLNLHNLRRHNQYLKWPDKPKTSIRRNFFIYRTIDKWNKLPQHVVSANTLPIFKLQLNKINLHQLYNSILQFKLP
jgi:hypothetical protein